MKLCIFRCSKMLKISLNKLRKKFEIPEEFQMNIGRNLTSRIRTDIPTFLNISLQRDAV